VDKKIKIINGSPQTKDNFGFIDKGNVFCVGRNYAKHIEELNSKNTGEPLIFMKPGQAFYQDPPKIPYPEFSTNVHYEVEIYIIIGKHLKNASPENIPFSVMGYGLCLDLTLRDIQDKAKKNGTPWTIAKGFDFSCPATVAYPVKSGKDFDKLQNYEFELFLNNTRVQHGFSKNMLYDIPFLISYISRYFSLDQGDIILTGTPEGVGQIKKGDTLVLKGMDLDPYTLTVEN